MASGWQADFSQFPILSEQMAGALLVSTELKKRAKIALVEEFYLNDNVEHLKALEFLEIYLI